ncbi:hypothetical protein G5V65_20665 [Rhodobacter sp. HX-7-19]|uniref:RcnB family protein n=1 Tax=Paragemmobacter kunshanensis TaxID=2583234 RepID=A0A6M1U654_9RHOB|nr:hypothetical protein [Rhodobacter kunshanensis]NGQ93304.1 hypothetical protein [Rhodobacter kunshanensis]
MRASQSLLASLIVLCVATPTFADGKRGKPDRHSGGHASIWNCPPGLAKKNPPCVPPGQAKKHAMNYGYRVGDDLRIDDFIRIRDPWTYGLDTGSGWEYYRDDRHIFLIDPGTRRILAVIELIEAFDLLP